MTTKHTITTTVEIELTIEDAAKWFCSLDDDKQAKFFVAVAEEAKTWEAGYKGNQWYALGSHLRNCECSTNEAREMIEIIAHGLVTGTHK